MYFCLFCIKGKEQYVRDTAQLYLQTSSKDEFSVWFPLKETSEKIKGVYKNVFRPLLPSYVFIYWNGNSESSFPFSEIKKINGAIRFLKYSTGSRALAGPDLEYAMWVHTNDGKFCISQVVFKENQRIHIVSGPLAGKDGDVIKVDRHHKRITLMFNLDGKQTPISFSVKFLEKNQNTQRLTNQKATAVKD